MNKEILICEYVQHHLPGIAVRFSLQDRAIFYDTRTQGTETFLCGCSLEVASVILPALKSYLKGETHVPVS